MGNCKSADTKVNGSIPSQPSSQDEGRKEQTPQKGTLLIVEAHDGLNEQSSSPTPYDDEHIVISNHRHYHSSNYHHHVVLQRSDEESQILPMIVMASPQASTSYDYPESPAMGLRSNTAFLQTPLLAAASQWHLGELPPSNNNTQEQSYIPHNGQLFGQAPGPLEVAPSSSSCHSSVGVEGEQHLVSHDADGDNDGHVASEEEEASIRRKASLAAVRQWFASTQAISPDDIILHPATD